MTLAALPPPERPRRLTLAELRDLPPTLSTEEAAPFWRVSPWSLYERVKRGDAPVEPLHIGRTLRWPTASVLRSVGIDLAEVFGQRRSEDP